jgi:hypothetical protein
MKAADGITLAKLALAHMRLIDLIGFNLQPCSAIRRLKEFIDLDCLGSGEQNCASRNWILSLSEAP